LEWGLSAIIAAGAFALTIGATIVAITRFIERIKTNAQQQVADAIKEERAQSHAALAIMEARFTADQETQDRQFGEVNSALRQFVTDIKEKIYQVEIWARDTLSLPLADALKDIRHTKRNMEMHTQIYGDLNNEVIRLQKDVERLSKLVNGKH